MALLRQIHHKRMMGADQNGKANCNLVLGTTLFKTIFVFKQADGTLLTRAQIKAAVSNIRLIIDGVDAVDCSPDFLLDLQDNTKTNKGAPTSDNGMIVIDHTRGTMESMMQNAALAWGTLDVGQITAEVEIVDVNAGGGSQILSSIDVKGDVIDKNTPLGAHIRMRPIRISNNTAGEHEVTSIHYENPNKGLFALHIKSGDVSKCTVRANSVNILEGVEDALNKQALKDAGRTPVAGYYHVDFSLIGRLQDFLQLGLEDFRVLPTFSSAPTSGYDIYIEEINNVSALVSK